MSKHLLHFFKIFSFIPIHAPYKYPCSTSIQFIPKSPTSLVFQPLPKMTSMSSLPSVLFLFLNLLVFGLAVTTSNCDSPPKHKHKHHIHKSSSPTSPPKLPPRFPLPSSPPLAIPDTPVLPPAFPLPRVSPPSAFPNSRKSGTCPRDAIRFGACAKVLGGLLGAQVGTPPKKPCCRLFGGLVEAEAAVCLCTAVKAKVFGFNLNVPVSIGLVLNACDMKTPPGFQCS